MSPQAPFALLSLPGHAPAPARVELVRVPLLRRAGLTVASGVFFWGLAVLLLVLPPHYPYFLGAMAFGVYFPHRFWTGRYRVRAFAGICPHCERSLSLPPGRRIDMPQTVPCYACHWEPLLEVAFEGPPPLGVRHRSGECVGRWELRWLADARFVVCDTCRAHHPATEEAWRQAEEENDRGTLLARLTYEGTILP